MIFKSILYSSNFEILTSKKFTSFLYFVFGSSILGFWYLASKQFIEAYLVLGEFDVSAQQFLATTLFIYTPFVLVGALMISNLIRRIRLHFWIKSRITHSNFSPGMSPAVAGLYVDSEYSSEEVWATLLRLHFDDSITITYLNSTLVLERNKVIKLSNHENVLLNNIFNFNQKKLPVSINDSVLIKAGLDAHKQLISDLTFFGYSKVYKSPHKYVRWIITTIYYFVGIVGLFLISYFIKMPELFTNILYPRFPVHPIQIATLIFTWLLVMLVTASGFFPKFNQNQKTKHSTAHLRAIGFYQYLKSVYSKKFSMDNISLLAKNDIKNFAPYMIGYGLISLDENTVSKIIDLTNDH